MLEVALITAALGVLVALVGLPPALALRSGTDGWVATGVDALLLGLLLLPLGITAWTWAGVPGAAVAVLGWLATLVPLVRRRVGLPRPGSWSARTAWLGAAWLVVLAVAVLLRLREVNFLPWIGDMGAYLNWANELARTGELFATWPPLFPAWLAVASALFGTTHTAAGMALTGLVLLLGVGRLVHQLGGGRVAALGAGAATALGLHAVWYSSFPSSEGLDAPLFLLWVLLAHRILVAASPTRRGALAVASGLTMVGLGMLRGSGSLLLLPLAGLLVAAMVVRPWRRFLPALWATAVANGVASVVVYWYGVSEIPKYFARTQMRSILPRALWDLLDDAGLFDATAVTAVALVGAAAVAVVLGRLLVRRAARARRGVEIAWPLFVALAVLVAAVVGWQWAVGGEVWAILHRMGPVLVVAALAAVVAAARGERQVQVTVLLLAAVDLLFLALHATRLGEARTHSFYLYWDRYLVSEVLPVHLVLAFLAAGWAAAALVGALRARARQSRPGVGAVVAGATVASLVALAVVPNAAALRQATGDVYLRGAYRLTEEIRALAERGDGAWVWGADGGGRVEDWTAFPNTWMAFAVPLERTFGEEVVNVHRGQMSTKDFSGDEVFRAADLPFTAACAQTDRLVLLEVATEGGVPADTRLADPDLKITRIGSVTEPVLFYTQPPGEKGWYAVDVEVTAWQVDIAPAARIDDPPCWTQELHGGWGLTAKVQ